MPRKDGTGPEGAGAKTGRGLGPCEDVSARRSAAARKNNRLLRGRPRGRGRSRGRG